MANASSVKRKFEGIDASRDYSSDSFTDVYIVVMDSSHEHPWYAIAADDGTTAIPSVGSAHPDLDKQHMRVRTVRPRAVGGSKKHFEVEVEYSSRVSRAAITFASTDGTTPQYFENPLNRPYQVTFGHTYEDVAMEVDRSVPARPVVNTVGQAFDPPIMTRRVIQIMSVSRTEGLIYPLIDRQVLDCINSTDWSVSPTLSFPARTVRVESIESSDAYDGTAYWNRRYEFHISDEPWNPTYVLNQGFYERRDNGDDGFSLVLARDGDGEGMVFPVNLDEEGKVIPPPPPFSSTNTHYVEFNKYKEIDFNVAFGPQGRDIFAE